MSAAQVSQVKQRFIDAYGHPPTLVVAAPGRVNLIGEHTDYNEGFVLPLCIERCTLIAAARTDGAKCKVTSANEGGNKIFDFAGDASLAKCSDWTNYMRGVVFQYLPDLPSNTASFEAAVLSNVPLGGGLSSSASLEVATGTMLEALYALPASAVDPVAKALRCQKCEHDFCDTPCGIMDQFVSACGRAGHALLIDCRKPYPTQQVPLDDEQLQIVIANSNVKHSLSGSEYPDRVRQCKEACAQMRSAGHGAVRFLRDATLEQLASVKSLDAVVIKRARHGISEDQRTLQAVEALKARDYGRVGALMVESHVSLRDDYEVSTPELDALVDIAMQVDGVYGSRMTGGGFGGCTVTLVHASSVPALLAAIATEYPNKANGKQATCFTTRPAGGAMVIQNGIGAETEACAALTKQPRSAALIGSGAVLGAAAALVAVWALRMRK